MKLSICLFLLLSNLLFAQNNLSESLAEITAYQQINDSLASAGYVEDEQFDLIKEFGFTHVINLMPGDYSHEDSLVKSNGMTFTQIEVDWQNPTMADLKSYFDDMKSHTGEKIFLHCQANMRASAFIYLYRIIELNEGEKSAKKTMNEIWQPNDTWANFIEQGFKKYGSKK